MPTMVFEVLAETAAKYGNRPAMRTRRNDAWQTTTWSEYERDVKRAGRSLIALGVQPGEGVSLIGQNSPEWVIADVAAIYAGAMPAGMWILTASDWIMRGAVAVISFSTVAVAPADTIDRTPDVEL